jgi:hypothetical protein
MDTGHIGRNRAISRAVVVSGLGIVVGLVLYRLSVFIPTMRASQFLVSGVSIGLAYAAFRGHAIRNGLAALLVWYAVLTGLIEDFNPWGLILNFAYIGGMAGATFVHQRVVETRFVRGAIQRVALAGAFMAIANGLIVVFLALFSWKVVLTHAATWIEVVYYNLQLGALIGLATGLGMELAEYLNANVAVLRNRTGQEKAATNSVAT